MKKGTIYVQPVSPQYAPVDDDLEIKQTHSAQEASISGGALEPAPRPTPNTRYYEPDRPERIPLGLFLADKIINGTTGTLSIDLKRPQVNAGQRDSLFTYRRDAMAPSGFAQSPGWSPGTGYSPPPPQPRRRGRPRTRPGVGLQLTDANRSILPDFAFNDAGARMKAMRHVSWGPKIQVTKYGTTRTQPLMDFGVGLEFELDTAAIRPLARLKITDVASIKLFPQPAIKFQKRVQLGTSGFAARFSYECPLEYLGQFYSPPARMLVSLENAVDTGVRLTQTGVEFAANKWLLDGAVRLRGAGVLELPSELPVAVDEGLVRFNVKRLGLKARW